MSHFRRLVSGAGSDFSPDLPGSTAAWAQAQFRNSTAEGLERKSKQMHPWRLAPSSSARKTDLGLPFHLLGTAEVLVVDPCLSYDPAMLRLCPVDPDPDPLAWCPSWSLALLCHHKHPWWEGLWAACPSPAPSRGRGVVGQALAGKTLPCQCCSMYVRASSGESVGWEGCLSFSRKAFNTVDTQNLSDYKTLCSSYFSSQFWNHIMVFHTKQAVLSKHPRKIRFCSSSFRYFYYINFNNNNRLTHCCKIIVGIYCRTSPKAVQLQFYQLMAQPQPADRFTS